MSDLDSRLTAALHAGTPPVRDPRFRVEVLVRLERTRFRRKIGATLAVACAAAVLLALSAQAIDTWMAGDVRRVWLVVLAALAAMFALSGVRVETPPGARTIVRTVSGWLYP